MRSIHIVALALVLAGSRLLASTTFNGASDSDFNNDDNWTEGLPDSGDALVNITATAVMDSGDYTGLQTVQIYDGGQFTLNGGYISNNWPYSTRIGVNYTTTQSDGTLIQNGGTWDYVELFVGFDANTATGGTHGYMTMNGGTSTAYKVYVGYGDLGAGTLSLQGGELRAGYPDDAIPAGQENTRFRMRYATSTSGTVDLAGGKLMLYGDWETPGSTHYNQLTNYINSGWMTINGQAEPLDQFSIDYDSGSGYTTVIPEPFSLSLVGLGACAVLLRRRFKI